MKKPLLSVCLFFLVASLALAQTKISGTAKCGKNTVEHMVPVGDHPNHSLGVTQGNCTWTKPWKIEGVASKEGTGTSRVDTDGDVAHNSGIYVDTMENGDKAIYHFQYSATTKNGQTKITDHHWQLVEGTGKLKGVKGQGTCKATANPDGTAEYECTGEFTAAKM